MASVYDFSARAIDGADVSLDRFRGQALLIVNTASKCGFTSQYAGLEKLHREFVDASFEVLGFPCNQFGRQELGEVPLDGLGAKEAVLLSGQPGIERVAVRSVDLDLVEQGKGHVEAAGAEGGDFRRPARLLTDREGRVVARYSPQTEPEAIKADIEKLI